MDSTMDNANVPRHGAGMAAPEGKTLERYAYDAEAVQRFYGRMTQPLLEMIPAVTGVVVR